MNKPMVIEKEEIFFESPSKRKCPHCKQQLIERTCGAAKFAGRIVLVAYEYCPTHGQPPVTKHQLKLSRLVSGISPLRKEALKPC